MMTNSSKQMSALYNMEISFNLAVAYSPLQGTKCFETTITSVFKQTNIHQMQINGPELALWINIY